MLSKVFSMFVIILLFPSIFLNNYPSMSLRAMSLSNSHVTIYNECTSDKDCNKGLCHIALEFESLKIINSECVCYTPYVSHKGICNYKQRDKSTALLLSIFLGTFGIDW